MAYTGIYNLLAMPAGVVPVTRVQPGEHRAPSNSRDWIDRSITRADTGSEGLPIGAQVIGRWWREDVVLALMRTIERQVRNSPEFPHASPLLADSSTTH
jgi:Asp-tRNA(Asn)/Glu-tRNA(Gln) amidotransferase A subunit family amidase